MKNKNVISLTIAFAILALGTSGLLLYFGLKPQAVTAIHVLFGLLFIGFIIFHIRNNWSSLKVYTRERKSTVIQKEFYVALTGVLVLLAGAALNLPPFGELVHAGENLTRGDKKGSQEKTMFAVISTNKEVKGIRLNLILQKKQQVVLPVMAIWIEDTAHRFVQNLFIPAKLMIPEAGETDIPHAIQEGEFSLEKINTGIFTQWQSRTKDSSSNYPDATPIDNFILNTNTIAINKFNVLVEIKNNEKAELYEAQVDASKADVFLLKSKDSLFLERAIVEIK